MTQKSDFHSFHLRMEIEKYDEIRKLAFDRKESMNSLMQRLINLGLQVIKSK